jgi:hypothetical protein
VRYTGWELTLRIVSYQYYSILHSYQRAGNLLIIHAFESSTCLSICDMHAYTQRGVGSPVERKPKRYMKISLLPPGQIYTDRFRIPRFVDTLNQSIELYSQRKYNPPQHDLPMTPRILLLLCSLRVQTLYPSRFAKENVHTMLKMVSHAVCVWCIYVRSLIARTQPTHCPASMQKERKKEKRH